MMGFLFHGDRNLDQIPHDLLPEDGCPVCGSAYVEALQKRVGHVETSWVVACYLGHEIRLGPGMRPMPEEHFRIYGPAYQVKALRAMIDAVVDVNCVYLKIHDVPPLYRSGVRPSENVASERLNTIPALLRARFGDVDDIAAWRVAELRKSGEDAQIRIFFSYSPTGKRLVHVNVRRSDGTLEDPSAILRSLP